MSTDREDRWGTDDDRDDRRRPRGDAEAGRRRIGTPAVLLIVFGLIAVLVEVGGLVAAFTAPDIMYTQMKKFFEGMPPGPDRQQALDDLEKEKDEYRLDTPMNLGGTVLGLVLSVLMLVGGVTMKSQSSYGLAMTGAVCAIIPCVNGCICCAMPVGIWALMVLVDPNVKAAFSAPRSNY